MGRYDKIKVYDGTTWRKPNRVYVHDGTKWVDFGTDDSSNKQTIFVNNSNSNVRVTLDKKVTTIVTDKYVQGEFNIYPSSGYCYNPIQNPKYDWIFECDIYKESNVDASVFWCGTPNGNRNIKITWTSDGYIKVEQYNYATTPTRAEFKSSNQVYAGNWVHLRIGSDQNGKNYFVIDFNGVKKEYNRYTNIFFAVTNATTIIGSSQIRFRNAMRVRGSDYYGNVNYWEYDMSEISGNSGYYSGVNQHGTSITNVEWV